MEFGLCSFAYRWSIGRPYYRPKHPMTIEGFLDKVASFGIKNAILCNNCELETYSDEQLFKLRDHSKELGINIELGARAEKAEDYLRMIEIAGIFDAKIMRIVGDLSYNNKDRTRETMMKELRGLLDVILPSAEEKDVCIAIECGSGAEELIETIEHYNTPYLGACLDSMNCVYSVIRPEELFSVLAPYAKTVHLKDYTIVPNKRGFIIAGVPLGEGRADFPRLLKYLEDAGYKGNGYLELYIDRKEDEAETMAFEQLCVEKSVAYAKELGIL